MRIASIQTFLPHTILFFPLRFCLPLRCFCVVDLYFRRTVSLVCALYYDFSFAWWETFDCTNTYKASMLIHTRITHAHWHTDVKHTLTHKTSAEWVWSWLLNIWNRTECEHFYLVRELVEFWQRDLHQYIESFVAFGMSGIKMYRNLAVNKYVLMLVWITTYRCMLNRQSKKSSQIGLTVCFYCVLQWLSNFNFFLKFWPNSE